MNEIYSMNINSPLGKLYLVASEHGLMGVHLSEKELPIGIQKNHSTEVLQQTKEQLAEYFLKQRQQFDIPLDPIGTEFQRKVWKALQTIPFGETRSYGQIAKAIKQPTASRAVGAANGRNPIMIIVPCHRVIGANGSLTGYAGGLPIKKWLLMHEQ